MIDPHGMDPQTVLRFVKSIGAWPGRVVVIACEPAEVEEMGWGLSDTVSAARRPRGRPGAGDGRRAALRRTGRRRRRGVTACTSCRSRARSSTPSLKHADGRRVTAVNLRVGRLRQVVPDTLEFYFEFVARDTRLRGRARSNQEVIDARLRCAPCEYEWAIEIPAFRCPTCGGSDVAIAAGNEFEVESIEVEEPEEAACIAQR